MKSRRELLIMLAATAAVSVHPAALAADTKAFDQKAFDAAQASGKPILIDVSAPWCPVCKVQAPIISKLMRETRFKELVAFNIDFDSQKALLKKFNVQRQSTLIVFRGKQEVGRSTGDTNPVSIEALMAKSI